ncbi:MAG TPA: hypothetical protein VMM13_11185 [Euzebya sp.]|nr:hypothetical protein [Euzebya sp.]
MGLGVRPAARLGSVGTLSQPEAPCGHCGHQAMEPLSKWGLRVSLHRQNPTLGVIWVIAIILAVTGSGRVADALLDQSVPHTAAPAFDPDLGVEAAIDALPQAIDALRTAVGAETFELLEATILQGGLATFQVRDPDNPANVDQYRWAGGELEDPVPVRLIGGGELDGSTFRIDQLTQEGARTGYDEAIALDLEDGEVTVISLSVTSFDGLAWTINVTGSRESRVVITDPEGKFVRSV